MLWGCTCSWVRIASTFSQSLVLSNLGFAVPFPRSEFQGFLFRLCFCVPAKAQFGTDLMNLMIVLPDRLKVLESEVCPIMECFRHDNCLLLFIPRLEGLKPVAWGFLLQVLGLEIWVNMVPYDIQSSIFLLICQ